MRTLRPAPLLKLLPLLALTLGACERALPTASAPQAVPTPRFTWAQGYQDFLVCTNGADGTFTVTVGGTLLPGTQTVLNGTCSVLYSYPNQFHAPGQNIVTITYQPQAGVTLDSIQKDSSFWNGITNVVEHTETSYTGTNSIASTVNNDAAARGIFFFHINPPACGTLTIGYWKTHAGFGPQPDSVTHLLPQWLGTAGGAKSKEIVTAADAVAALTFYGDASNPVNRLYAQLLGAKLNIADGVDGSAVASTIAAADAFLAQYDNTSVLTKTQIQQVNAWQTTLDNYNNGLIGPGHCSN